MFSERSRYAGQPVRERTARDGRRIAYALPRDTPAPETLQPGGRVAVTDSDRLDGLAYRHLGDPGAWWMIADANRAMHPAEVLASPGADIVIPVPGPKGLGR
jgi:hypothetical protein